MANLRKTTVLGFLLVVSAVQTIASDGLLFAPSSAIGSRGRTSPVTRKTARLHRGATPSEIRGGGLEPEEQEGDHGGTVAGMFGNLRIPASLIAGSSLGSAFALPFLASDAARIDFAKRMYIFSMITTLASMLLVVILSTIVMNDISLRPSRLAKSVGDYIDEHCALEWMMVRSAFFYGSLAFMVGSAFRAWISIACPIMGRAVVGILSSISITALSYITDKVRVDNGRPLGESVQLYVREIGRRTKRNPLFGIGVSLFVISVSYLIVKLPHMYSYIVGKHS